MAIFSLGASSCDRQEQNLDVWQLEFIPKVGFHWCVPIDIDGRIECKKSMSIPESHKKGMLGTTAADFEELVKRYNKLKRDCGQ